LRYSSHWKAYFANQKRENARAIFEVIERELGYDGPFDIFNIEYCVPDSETEKNTHIGNLMLLEERINHVLCKGKPLDQKI